MGIRVRGGEMWGGVSILQRMITVHTDCPKPSEWPTPQYCTHHVVHTNFWASINCRHRLIFCKKRSYAYIMCTKFLAKIKHYGRINP